MQRTDPTPPADSHLAGLALVTFTGPDASGFLQGQLTQDMRRLAEEEVVLAACNTAQGRVISVMRLRSIGNSIHALVANDVVDALVAHLKRYVLRAKVTIAIDREAKIVGRTSASRAETFVLQAAFSLAWAPGREVLVAPATGSAGVGSPVKDGRGWNAWLAADIADGLPYVNAAASGHFVAQMLNLDLLDAIGFAKGCYTGQEIVARTQNLGRIKRRLLRYRVAGGPTPATLAPLRHSGHKVGEVLQAASTIEGDSEMLAVVTTDVRDIALELDDGRAAEPRPLPYTI